MNRIAVILFVIAAGLGTALLVQNQSNRILMAKLHASEARLAAEQAASAELTRQMNLLKNERDQYQKDAADVHRLRGEVSSLRNSRDSLAQQLARALQAARGPAGSATPSPAEAAGFSPPAFKSYREMGKFVAGLRAKAFSGAPLSAEERAYLQNLTPALEKLERSPAEFAAFQTELIQSAAGITDDAKAEKIRQLIQRVYENAVTRGLDLTSRPVDDVAWVEDRYRLDRRGTSAVQGMLSPEEREAFDRQFVGIMGVDLGINESKTVSPGGAVAPR